MPLDEFDGEDALVFLSSLQLADSFFPSGLYTLSYGLEAFAQDDQVGTGNLAALVADFLRYGAGPTDGVALACAHRAVEDDDLDLATQADARLTAVKLPREARETSVRIGRHFLTLTGHLFGSDVLGAYAARVHSGAAPGNHAIALGLVMATLGIPRERAVAGELYVIASGWVAAAVRLGVTDHRHAQAILHRLKPVIAESARVNCHRGVRDIASCVPRIDIMAMLHERAEVRLFMS